MESWHRVGQKVTPKDSRPWRDTRSLQKRLLRPIPDDVVFGEVVTISGICIRSKDADIMLVFAEKDQTICYTASSFAPVRETSVECFRHLLSPTPEQVRELAELDA